MRAFPRRARRGKEMVGRLHRDGQRVGVTVVDGRWFTLGDADTDASRTCAECGLDVSLDSDVAADIFDRAVARASRDGRPVVVTTYMHKSGDFADAGVQHVVDEFVRLGEQGMIEIRRQSDGLYAVRDVDGSVRVVSSILLKNVSLFPDHVRGVEAHPEEGREAFGVTLEEVHGPLEVLYEEGEYRIVHHQKMRPIEGALWVACNARGMFPAYATLGPEVA